MTKSYMSLLVDGIGGNKTCVEHNLYMCNRCLVKECELLREQLAAARLTLAQVGNVIGGPVAAMSDELRHSERVTRIDKAALMIAEALNSESGPIRERLADLCHQQWSKWMIYLFSKSEKHSDRYVIPAWAVKRWRAQMLAPYSKLTPEEQASDQREADHFIQLLCYGGSVMLS